MFTINSNFFHAISTHLLSLMLVFTSLSMTTAFGFKMGVIDGQVIMGAPELDISDKQKQIINKYYPQLVKLNEEYSTLKNEFDKNEVLMDASTRKAKQDKLMQVAKSMNALKQKAEMTALQIEQETTQKLSDISTQIAKKHGFDVILTTTTTGGYVSKNVDMTKEALKILKQKAATA